MRLFNSLGNKMQDFTPINEDSVRIYSCGPTVYDNLHIGNLSAFIYADIVRRSFEAEYSEVRHVMNITDIDDKTIRDSKRDYPDDDPMIALKKLTDKYSKVFMDDLRATGNDTDAIQFISAVDTIPEMILLIQKLLDNKIAYIAEDAVYFSITKYYQAGHTYGVLQKIATQQSKARIANDEYNKDNAGDFALWKRAEAGEPSWDATFSEDNMPTNMPGRPGWHIECSAMSEKLLGLPFDVHTGGIDLKFPHHENEIAQTMGASKNNLANYFVHNNHILVDGKKMSKSLGNFYTLRDIEKKGYSAAAFRLLVLASHYHSESQFSWDILDSAKNRLAAYEAMADLQHQVLPEANMLGDDYFTSKQDDLVKSLQDNLNTPQALVVLSEVENDIDRHGLHPTHTKEFSTFLHFVDKTLGLTLSNREDITAHQKKQLEKRETARHNKDWAASDTIRDELAKQGLTIKDHIAGQIWTRLPKG